MANRQIESAAEDIWPYGALVLFCLLTAFRDVISENVFKDVHGGTSPQMSLLIFCAITQIGSLVYLLMTGGLSKLWRLIRIDEKNRSFDVLMLNGFTLIGFLTYFLAIATPLGAGLNSFIDYAVNPLFTAIVAAYLVSENLTGLFWGCTAAAIIGLAIFFSPRISIDWSASGLWVGLAFCITSAFASGVYRSYNKKLLALGFEKIPILFTRLIFATVALGIYCAYHSEFAPMTLSRVGALTVLGFVGFFLPLALTLYILQKMHVKRFALAMYSIPIMTYGFSYMTGHTQFYSSDLLAMVIVFASLGVQEFASGAFFTRKAIATQVPAD